MSVSQPSTPPQVLVVDDNQSMRFLVAAVLDQAGFEVVEAEDGEVAVARFQETAPAIVLMDVLMPVMDGFSACAAIKALPGGEQTPILMMTGLEDLDSINQAFEAGATDFITKPINYDLLGHRVRYALRATEATAALRASERGLAEAQRIAMLGNWEWRRGKGVRWSTQALNLLDLDGAAGDGGFEVLLGRVLPEDHALVEEWLEDVTREGKPTDITHRIRLPGSEVRHLRHLVEAELDEDARIGRLRGTVQDISQLREAEERVHRLAFFDSLTGLANRELFKEHVGQAMVSAQRHVRGMAVIFIDVDDFKRINDTLGHNVGDHLLMEVASRLRRCVRESDVVGRDHLDDEDESGYSLARLGGDEFTVLLNEIQRDGDAARVAGRVLEAVSTPFQLGGHEVRVSASVGIAVYPADGTDMPTLLKHADVAMYHAKRQGKNAYYFFSKELNLATIRRLALEEQLGRALEHGELRLVFQPQMDLLTNRLSGMEALLRWSNPVLGEISPQEFIPVAEETGLIVPIGEWVLREACKQARAWNNAGFPLKRMAVNVSVLQFVQPAFVELVGRVLEEAGLEPETLELEITESLLMKDPDGAVRILKALKSLGVQLAIDDFGTGYSSLTYLKQFPIDRLKIDRAFVKNVNAEPKDAAIADAVIALADRLSMKVTAEGVENTAQLRYLAGRQCSDAQGFLMSHPLPPAELISLVEGREFPNSDQPKPRDARPSVLVVDDEPSILEVARHGLEQEGFRVLCALNGPDALDTMAQEPVDVLISDFAMPGMDGNELLERVRRVFPATVRIMLSGRSDMQSISASINRAEVFRYIEKPVHIETLRDAVYAALTRSSVSPKGGR